MLVNQVMDGVQWLRGELQSEGVFGLVGRLPAPLRHAAEQLLATVPLGAVTKRAAPKDRPRTRHPPGRYSTGISS